LKGFITPVFRVTEAEVAISIFTPAFEAVIIKDSTSLPDGSK
jgi:hypothetical protein